MFINSDILVNADTGFRLTAPAESDIMIWYKWLNDPEVVKYSTHKKHVINPKDANTYLDQYAYYISSKEDRNRIQFMIRKHSKPIGTCSITQVHKLSSICSIEILIGDKSCWNKGLATAVIKELLVLAKNMGYRKVTAGACFGNIGSIRAFEKNGFEKEAILKKHHLIGTEYHDIVCMAKFIGQE